MNPKHKSLLFKERSSLGWTWSDSSSCNLSWSPEVRVSVLTPLKFQIIHNFVNKIIIMADRVVFYERIRVNDLDYQQKYAPPFNATLQ